MSFDPSWGFCDTCGYEFYVKTVYNPDIDEDWVDEEKWRLSHVMVDHIDRHTQKICDGVGKHPVYPG